MKNAFFYLAVMVLAIACDATDGLTSLVDISDEPPGANCLAGGVKITSGIDQDGNGTLDANEVATTKFVCDGSNGLSTLMLTTTEPAGTTCTNGGTKVQIGKDVDNDGQLDASEVEQTRYVCNGTNGNNGAAGTDGTNGSNGVNSLINMTNISEGTQGCIGGGVKIQSGRDINNNGQLDGTEIEMTKTVCNGIGSEGPKIELKYTASGVNGGTLPSGMQQDPTLRSWTLLYDDFDIANFQDYDSIIYTIQTVAVFNVGGIGSVPGVNQIFELVNAEDLNNPIPGSELQAPAGSNYKSGNCRANFPPGKMDLAISIRSTDATKVGVAFNITLILIDKE